MLDQSRKGEIEYLSQMQSILTMGNFKESRTGINTISKFGGQLEFDLTSRFPLLTTKRVHFPSIAHELLWFISGDTNIKYLTDNKVRIWSEWASPTGDLGPVYGHQWRNFNGTPEKKGVDQLQNVIDELRTNPDSRQMVVSAWNPQQKDEQALPPCHMSFQFESHKDWKTGERILSCHMYQRSADWFLGVPFNIACYALLTHMVAKITGHKVGRLIMSFGDMHVYDNLITQCQTQLKRDVKIPPNLYIMGDQEEIDDFKFDDFLIANYEPHPGIKGKVAV